MARAAFWLLLVAAVAVALLQLRRGWETEEQRRYAEMRTAFVPESFEVLGTIDRALRETSGLAVSVRYPDVVWSHNDSGDDARVYALDRSGAVVARLDLEGIEARDWEAMDRGPCALDPGTECLYLADTGDNVRRRDVLVIHLVPEPDPYADLETVSPEGSLRYLYPDGPRDAEAVAVAADGTVVIVTKGRAGEIRLFSIDPEAVRRAIRDDAPVQLDAGTRLPIEPDWDVGRVATGAAFRPDGGVLAVRTLSEIYFFGWPDLDEVAPPCFLGRQEPQGEAIAWEPSGAILLSSETNARGPGRLLRVRCGGV
jgi:hypothetical protein